MKEAKRIRLAWVFVIAGIGTCFRPAETAYASAPIVQQLGSDSVVILQHTGAALTMSVEYRAVGAETWKVANGQPGAKRHVIRLTGLAQDSEHEYRTVDAAGRERGRGSFHTAPLAGTGKVRFAAFGDSGGVPWWIGLPNKTPIGLAPWLRPLGRTHQWAVARRVREHDPELILHLGDVAYPRGERDHYREAVFLPFAELLAGAALYPTVGNHDVITHGAGPLFEAFEVPGRGHWYDFVYGPVQFLCLATYGEPWTKGTEQYRWLARQLAKPFDGWRVLFTHRPFFSASRSRLDRANRVLREQIGPLLAKHGVDLVLSGHDHLYQRFEPVGGVHYVVEGGGGKNLYEIVETDNLVASARQFGFVLVDADRQRLELRAISVGGAVLDRLVLTR